MASSMQRAKLRILKNSTRPKSSSLKGGVLRINIAAQMRYKKKLYDITRKMTKETNRTIEAFLDKPIAKEQFAMDASITSHINNVVGVLNEKYQEMFDNSAQKLAEQMTADISKSSKTSLTFSLKQISEALTLKLGSKESGLGKIAQAVVSENVKLIKSIPDEYFQKVKDRMKDTFVSGSSTADVLNKVVEAGEITQRRADLIALDQTRKAYSSFNTARMQAVGIEMAEWIHSGGSMHPRESHEALDGTEYNIDEGAYDDDYGDYVQPAELVNCLCTMRPIVSFDDNSDESEGEENENE